MKRSHHVALALLGAAAFGIAACTEEKTEANAFPDKASCLAAAKPDGWFSAADCETAFAEAQKLLEETAPRYESRELCEAEHGAGACGADAAANNSGGGSVFMPLLMGYMIGQALSGGGRVMAQPVMRTAGGGFSTPDGGTRISSLNSAGTINASAFNKAPVTKGLAPMTKTQVQSRGGFGGSGTARAVGG
ncbi:MAG: hypothetical protein CFE33_15805 [Pseudorhodobacter sp. PARRP1]|nr:MAG: hypothetical protein CFE33_15805 [Pseudorhodobacter sp. PARRP1]